MGAQSVSKRSGLASGIPFLATARVRFATMSAISGWNGVFERPQYRAWVVPSWVNRAGRCSTTWCRFRS
jgi:hypothetical protein